MANPNQFIHSGVLLLLICIGRSQQFVANCIWENSASANPNPDDVGEAPEGRSFVMSDADACAIFCSGSSTGQMRSSKGQMSPAPPGVSALCQRCCKGTTPDGAATPGSRPTDLLYRILATVMSAFGSKTMNPNPPPSDGTRTVNRTASASEAPDSDRSATQDPVEKNLEPGPSAAREQADTTVEDFRPRGNSPITPTFVGGRNVQLSLDEITYDSLFHRLPDRS